MNSKRLFLAIFTLCSASLVSAQRCHFNHVATFQAQEFTSPGYPAGYPNNLNCVWIIESASGQTELQFLDFATEEEIDYVQVLEGPDADSLLLRNATGRLNISDDVYISSRGVLRVDFVTDRNDSDRGFRARYRTALPMKFNISSIIQDQLAQTTVQSHVTNLDSATRQVTFSHILPHDAVLSAFRMTSDDVTYEGILEIRGKALQEYQSNLMLARTTAFVTSNREALQMFSISFNLRPGGEMRFSLKYWILLERVRSSYTYRAVVERAQFVGDICVDIYLCSSEPLQSVAISEIASADRLNFIDSPANLSPGYDLIQNRNFAHVIYRHPPEGEREEVPFDGEFQLRYDTERNFQNGVFYVDGEYFAHIFSPALTPIPRRIVFVLDISGSMSGLKIEQLRLAMRNILRRLDENVFFNIVLFSDRIRVWMGGANLIRATPEDIAAAERFIFSAIPSGGTDIFQALSRGLQLLSAGSTDFLLLQRETVHPLLDYLVFLTDGTPSQGVSNPSTILNRISRMNSRGYGIISIGFGVDVNFQFLRDLSSRNNGISKQVFEDAGAAVQIETFLVGTIFPPTLLDFTLSYPDGLIAESTNQSSRVLLDGSEFVVLGRLNQTRELKQGDIIPVRASGMQTRSVSNVLYNTPVRYVSGCVNTSGFSESRNVTERKFALKRVEELLRLMRSATNREDELKFRRQAIDLSLRYSLVSNVTVLVIMEEVKEIVAEVPATTPTPPPTLSPITDEPLPWLFEGDPHFIIPLRSNLTICFTWGGKPEKIYNLLHDPRRGIDVRGKIVSAPELPHPANSTSLCPKPLPRTYFYEVGFSFLEEKVALKVNPHNITIYDFTRAKLHKTMILDATDNPRLLQFNGAKLEVFKISKMHSFVNISIHGLATFSLILRRVRNKLFPNPDDLREDHVDMDLIGAQNFSPDARGVFGDFLSTNFRKSSKRDRIIRKKTKSILVYRKHRFEVQHANLSNPMTAHDRVECWFSCDSEDLIGKATEHYIEQDLIHRRFL